LFVFLISTEAGPFRRIQLNRYLGSHKRLCEAAAELATSDQTEARVVQYKLRLTFKDEEGDNCLILNDSDLKIAFQDRTTPLKVFAEILELSAVSANPPSVTPEPAPANIPQTRTEPTDSETPAVTSHPTTNTTHPPALHHAMESIVGVLANAVIGLQNGLEGSNNNNNGTFPSATTATNNNSTTTPEASTTHSVSAAFDSTSEAAASEEAGRPFIHGRHTCDGCLTTPIVGKRFHAVNMPDYDLCTNCMENYKGEEIKFEEAELERDAPMQDRWHRRWAKFGTAGRPHFRKHGARRGGPLGPRGFGPRRFPPPFAPHHPPNGGPPPHFPPHGPPHHQSLSHQYPNMEDVDAALKEAIRRSMEDVKEAETQTETKQTSTEGVQTDPEPEVEDKKTSGWPKELTDVLNDPTKWKCKCCGVRNEENLDACAACTVLRGESGELDIIVEPEAGSAPVLVNHSDAVSATFVTPPANGSSKSSSGKSTPKNTPTEAEKSFSLDAEGQGDVAEILGSTMDQIANAIRAMDEEIARETSGSNDDSDDDDTEGEEAKVGSVTESNRDKGDVIVSGEDNEDEISQNSWDVVEDQTAHDESLARAACMIGSALFNSGMSDSHANSNTNSNPSDGSIGSIPTSVPSLSSQPILPAALVQRWSVQLNQMHELGFFNDALTIETLERLNAANIGSDENEEISVTRVVNEMMKDW